MLSRIVFLIGLLFLALVFLGDSSYQTEWALLFGAFMSMSIAFRKDQTTGMKIFYLLPILILVIAFIFKLF